MKLTLEVLYRVPRDPLDCKDESITEVRVVEASKVLQEEINLFYAVLKSVILLLMWVWETSFFRFLVHLLCLQIISILQSEFFPFLFIEIV